MDSRRAQVYPLLDWRRPADAIHNQPNMHKHLSNSLKVTEINKSVGIRIVSIFILVILIVSLVVFGM